jgi:outer membrane protein assembly factor BamB
MACQGGVILKGSSDFTALETWRSYPEWMFQADLLPVLDSTSLIVCGHSLSRNGMVVHLSSDLKQEKWKTELDYGPIHKGPLLVRSEIPILWVLVGRHAVQLSLLTGEEVDEKFELPRACVSSPVLIQRDPGYILVYASSDWEGGLMLLDPIQRTVSVHADSEIGPVHKDMTYDIDSNKLFISDTYGSLHCVDVTNMQILSSVQVSSYPLSSPSVVGDTLVAVGSYDGSLYCMKFDPTEICWKADWECDCRSVIYAKPLPLEDGRIKVCTTAGDIFTIGKDGNVLSEYKVAAEIWSSPILIRNSTPTAVAFGARDSRCHLLTME